MSSNCFIILKYISINKYQIYTIGSIVWRCVPGASVADHRPEWMYKWVYLYA